MYIIYKHTLIKDCESYGKSYIGLTKQCTSKRWQNGKGYPKTQKVFFNAIQKYGWENFRSEILEEDIKTLEEANLREQYWISYYHTYIRDPDCWGYNSTVGGDGAPSHVCSEEAKLKMSQAKRGKYLGKNNPRYGVKASEIAKQHMSEAHKGVKLSAAHAKAIGEANKGRSFSDKSKLKIANAQEGHLNHMYGKKVSNETKQKISAALVGRTSWNAGKTNISHCRAVVQLTLEGDFVAEFFSIADAKRATKFTTIGECCRGKKIAAGGYKWMYKEEYLK